MGFNSGVLGVRRRWLVFARTGRSGDNPYTTGLQNILDT